MRPAAGMAGLALLALLVLLVTTDAFVCLYPPAGTNKAVECVALGDLFKATNGTGWDNGSNGWTAAAAGACVCVPNRNAGLIYTAKTGIATDYCTFTGAACESSGRLQHLCACCIVGCVDAKSCS